MTCADALSGFAVRDVLALVIFAIENHGKRVVGGGHGSCTFPWP